jgi:hypothetical protein
MQIVQQIAESYGAERRLIIIISQFRSQIAEVFFYVVHDAVVDEIIRKFRVIRDRIVQSVLPVFRKIGNEFFHSIESIPEDDVIQSQFYDFSFVLQRISTGLRE